MKDYIVKRALSEANHVIETDDTIRKTAKIFGMSKSTVHLDLTKRLEKIDNNMRNIIQRIFDKHTGQLN